jgi:hypothetical protein
MAEKADYLRAFDAAVEYFASGAWIAALPDLRRISIHGRPHSIRQVCALVEGFADRLPDEVYRVLPRRGPTEAREGRIVCGGGRVPARTDRAAHSRGQGASTALGSPLPSEKRCGPSAGSSAARSGRSGRPCSAHSGVEEIAEAMVAAKGMPGARLLIGTTLPATTDPGVRFSNRAMAVRAARQAVSGREPHRRRRLARHAGGGQCAARWIHAVIISRDNCQAFTAPEGRSRMPPPGAPPKWGG